MSVRFGVCPISRVFSKLQDGLGRKGLDGRRATDMTPVTISNSIDFAEDTIDVSNIIERVEELEDSKAEAAELAKLKDLLARIRGPAGDIDWRGYHYPEFLIRDDFFMEHLKMDVDSFYHAKNLAHYVVIDWEATTANVRVDYKPVDVAGARYWHLIVPKADSVVYRDQGAYKGLLEE
jgi:hypothetical protein